MPKSLLSLLAEDLAHALVHNGSILNEAQPSLKRCINVCLTPCMLVNVLHRLAHRLWQKNYQKLAGMLAYINFTINRIDIHPACQIKGGLYVPHPAGVIIRAHSGRDFVVLANASICDNGRTHPAQWPRIGNGVWIAAGARVSGSIQIGDNARVGPRAILFCSLPNQTVAYAQPYIEEMSTS